MAPAVHKHRRRWDTMQWQAAAFNSRLEVCVQKGPSESDPLEGVPDLTEANRGHCLGAHLRHSLQGSETLTSSQGHHITGGGGVPGNASGHMCTARGKLSHFSQE
jgi:hypothetical protein